MVSSVRTVLGDVRPEDLGVCDAHDHLFLSSPQLPGRELGDATAARAELEAFRAAGGSSVVQWTPWGMGRRAADLPLLSRAAGVHVVCATGLHQAAHYTTQLLDELRGRLADVFVSELTEGIGTSGVRAGIVKVAGGFHALDTHARWTMIAAAEAHHATGAPIAVHLEMGTGALDVFDLLCSELGVPPHRVILGHLNRSPDLVVQRQAAEAGCWLAFDGPSRAHHTTDWRMPRAVQALAEAGFGHRLLLGGDTVVAGARSVDGGPGMPYLLRRVRPRLALELGEELTNRVLTENPGRAFAVEWR
ncbi:phosphotriesterase family protein [Streptomyces guryensis]|uniref:Phosphotriesterase n=1 Tax=Streptomyces guryensis TaxID=2886947 RepID=A0A9Q3VMJ2_9ACTN|nr:phosphotriesterase [Streptomyces guryensis]MCD9875041.1 phosphotriesterase [Streptomyces guryensis]